MQEIRKSEKKHMIMHHILFLTAVALFDIGCSVAEKSAEDIVPLFLIDSSRDCLTRQKDIISNLTTGLDGDLGHFIEILLESESVRDQLPICTES